jgi:hypothetical protein
MSTSALGCLGTTVLFLLFNALQAQTPVKVDYELIKRNIEVPGTGFSYPALLSRFVAGDTSMTIEELRYCYYGYTFQAAYQSHKRAKAIDLIDTMIVHYPTQVDTVRVHHLIDSALVFCPFDLNALLYRIRFAGSGYGKEARLAQWKILAIERVIESSGDGLTKKTAYSVLFIPHEYLMIHHRGLSRTGTQSLSRNEMDEIEVIPNESKIKNLYFDVSGMHFESDPSKVIFHQYYHAYLNMHPLPLALIGQ